MARVACLYSVEYYGTIEHPLPHWGKIPYGLSIIAACLERAGHEVRCWVACPKTPLAHLANEIVRDFRCDTLLASSVSTQFPLISRICEEIKISKPSLPILLGGVHASVCTSDCLSLRAFDAVCVGEGENAALAWADAIAGGIQPRGIPGLSIKIQGTDIIDSSPPPPFRTNLDDLPLINYAHWERWVDPEDRTVTIVIGRGCPYSCTYCSNHALRRLQTGPYVRFRSPARILAEMQRLLNFLPDVRSIYLEIETICASMPWLFDLCSQLRAFNATRQTPLSFTANIALTSQLVQDTDRLNAVLNALRGANIIYLNVGLESGSPRIRKEILNRPFYTNTDLIRFCRSARRAGLKVGLYMMVGVPTETPNDAIDTCAVARTCEPHDIYPSIFYPYPGTELHKLSAQMQLINLQQLGTTAERARAYLTLDGFPRWRVYLEHVLATWRVFSGRRRTVQLLRVTAYTALRVVPGALVWITRAKSYLRRLRHHSHSPAPVPTAAD